MTNLNTHMRKGFTMIELVFVIVIIGILAAVALPKFTGISDDAHVSKLQAFTGTLNRTVGPSIWSGIMRNVPTAGGSVKHADAQAIAKYKQIATDSVLGADAQVESIPSEFATQTLDLSLCAASTVTIPKIGDDASAVGGDLKESVTIGSTTYKLGCVDGNLNSAPKFYLYDAGTSKLVTK